MKKIQAIAGLVIALSLTPETFSQGVTIGSQNPPDPSAVLDVQSTSQGVLFPRLTTTQRNAIVNPATGLAVYNTTTGCMEMYMPIGGWRQVVCDCPVYSSPFFSYSPQAVFNGMQVQFTSNIPNVSYNWTFTSGSPASSTSANPTASWSAPGTYDVVLQVTANGCTNSDTLQITVNPSFRNCMAYKISNPNLPDGIYSVDPDGPTGNPAFNCYCDMTNDGGGWASIFTLQGNLTLTNTTCLFNYSNDDMDGTILWKDLELRLSNSNTDNTNGANYFRVDRAGVPYTVAQVLPDQPTTPPGTTAKPVPLPGAQKVVWFDHQNSRILWDNISIPFASVNMTWAANALTRSNNAYFISDGVDVIQVGYGSNATLLRFNFETGTVAGTPSTPLSPAGGWFATEEDQFSHVLWTVNSRVMYYAGSPGNFRLAGTQGNPQGLNTTYTVPEPLSPSQPGIDFFGYVDNAGFLWFADWGHDNGSYFNCGGNDSQLGVGQTNIMLTY